MGLVIGGIVVIIISAIVGWSIWALLVGIAALLAWVIGYNLMDNRDSKPENQERELLAGLKEIRKPQKRKFAWLRAIFGLPTTKKSLLDEQLGGH